MDLASIAGLFAAMAVLSSTVGGGPGSPDSVSTEQLVESLVRDLGAEQYDARERATESLRRIGRPALAGLEKAAESTDPEVRVRARRILEDVRLGIAPDWPSEMVILVRHYEKLSENERSQALARISQTLGEKALPFFLQRLAGDSQRESGWAFSYIQRINSDEAAERILEAIKEPKNPAQTQALAWARYRAGTPIDALRLLPPGEGDAGLRNQATEAAVKSVIALLKDRKFEEALRGAADIAKAAPEDSRPLYLEAEVSLALDKGDDAKAFRAKALAMNPNNEAGHYAAGEMLQDMGRRRLAAAEWEAILKMPPDSSVYDINAHLRLGAIYEASGLFERAAKSLQTALDLYTKARDAEHGMAMAGGTEDSLRLEIQRLTQKAAQFPAPEGAAIEDELGEDELRLDIAIVVKDGKLEDLRRDAAAVVATLGMDVQPAGLRLFDEVPATLRYDPAKKELSVLLNDTLCAKPAPLDLKEGGEARVAITTLDRVYVFSINPATGEAKQTAKYDKDYVVTFKPGIRLLALTDVTIKINGKRYAWDETQKGITLDFLPKELDVVVEGTTPAGRRITTRAKLAVREPPLAPARPAKAAAETKTAP